MRARHSQMLPFPLESRLLFSRTFGKRIFTGSLVPLQAFRNFVTTMAAKKTALLLLANGAEEMEAVITVDVLRRAGVSVTVASITDSECIKCSRDVKICADKKLSALADEKFDVVILPGGLEGSNSLATSEAVGSLLKQQEKDDRVIAAICAAPLALKSHNIAKGKRITSYPAMKDKLADDYVYLEDKVVVDGNVITSRGPATAFAFGLAIAEKLVGKETAAPVAKAMLYEGY